MRKLVFVFILGVVLSCTKSNYPHHSSMNSLDWAGRYEGTLPGAKGAVDQAVLVLKDDLSYELWRNGEKSVGGFAWGPDGGRIVLPDESLNLFVGENFVKAITRRGKDINGGAFQMVKKEDTRIVEKYWKLIELNGKPVVVSEGGREPHLILKEEEFRVIGNGGCNNLMGGYEVIESTGRIRFFGLASTMMACSDAQYEAEFFKVLEEIDNFSTDGHTLSLQKARRAPQARFEVVYLK